MEPTRLAGIDIGSNSVRLLITDVIDYKGETFFKKEYFFRIPLQLGEDTFSTGSISDEKKESLATLIESYKGIMTVCGVNEWRICATSAVREASNATEVIKYINQRTGLDVDIIDHKAESYYIVLNNQGRQQEKGCAYLFVDVGGGSTDVSLYYEDQEIASDSFRLGTIRPMSLNRSNQEWDRIKLWLNTNCTPFPKLTLIGSGGNINKINSLLRKCGKVKREELVSFYRKLKDIPLEERAIRYNMNLNRATVIMPAIQIYLQIMKMARILTIETPVIGVSDGIIRDLYYKSLV